MSGVVAIQRNDQTIVRQRLLAHPSALAAACLSGVDLTDKRLIVTGFHSFCVQPGQQTTCGGYDAIT
jgi:hypothetical protein